MSSNLSPDKLAQLLSLAPLGHSSYEFNSFIVNENIGRHRQFRAVIEKILYLQSEAKNISERIKNDSLMEGFAAHLKLELAKIQSDLNIHQKWLNQFDEDVIQNALKNFEDSEPEYWVHSVGTQAAIDIMTAGKMSEETIRKMMLMKKDDFSKTVIIATKISNQVKNMMVETENSMV